MRKLSLLPSLYPDESLDSYIEHLSELQVCTPRQLLSMSSADPKVEVGTPLARRAPEAALVRLSDLTGLTIHQLTEATTVRFAYAGLQTKTGTGRAGDDTWSFAGHVGYCPECLHEDDLRWNIWWYLRWTSICERHDGLLLDQCPSCHRPPRSGASFHPRRVGHPTTLRRIQSCDDACSSERMAQAPSVPLDSGSHAVIQHRWLTNAIKQRGAQCPYADGQYLSAATILRDLTILVRHALQEIDPVDQRIPGAQDPELPHFSTSWLMDAESHYSQSLRQVPRSIFLVAQTAAVDILRTKWSATTCESWITPSRAATLAGVLKRRPREPVSNALVRVVDLHRGVNHFRPGTLHFDNRGRRRTQQAYRTFMIGSSRSIDAKAIPASIWPVVAQNVPPLPPHTHRVFPQLAPMALALVGRQMNLKTVAPIFGLEISAVALGAALSNMIVHEHGRETYIFLMTLHEHLRANPPPIDYRRRRSLWPRPTDIGRNHMRELATRGDAYLTEAFRWKATRFVWQLLTGNDPLFTRGSELLHGPAAYSYRGFVRNMPLELQQAAGEVAQKLLLHHRIGEPVTYSPNYLGDGQWTTGTGSHFLDTSHRTDLRKSSTSLAQAASTAGNPEALVHVAISGNALLAQRLIRFAKTDHTQNHSEGAALVGVTQPTMKADTDYIETCLGNELYLAADRRARTRTITSLGAELSRIVSANIDRLEEVVRTPEGPLVGT